MRYTSVVHPETWFSRASLSVHPKAYHCNALGVALDFCVLLFSPMRVHAHIAALIFIGMVLASSYTLLWLTSILPNRAHNARDARDLSSSTNLW